MESDLTEKISISDTISYDYTQIVMTSWDPSMTIVNDEVMHLRICNDVMQRYPGVGSLLDVTHAAHHATGGSGSDGVMQRKPVQVVRHRHWWQSFNSRCYARVKLCGEKCKCNEIKMN